MIHRLSLRYEVMMGDPIYLIAQKMCIAAQQYRLSCSATFNSIDINATPKDTPEDVVARYEIANRLYRENEKLEREK